MKQVSLASLANDLAKPGFERQLIPLLMYKGQANLGRVQRLWNLTVAMMMHEAESISEGITHLQMNPEWSQLCFPEKRVQHCGMRGFLNRLRDNRPVTDLVPGLTEYVEWLQPRFFPYQRVPLEASRARCAWWRKWEPKLPLGSRPPEDFAASAAGKPAHVLADIYNVSPYIVRKWKHLLGIERYVREPMGVPFDFDEHAPKERTEALALRYGVSEAVIYRWRAETGLACELPRRTAPKLPMPDDFFEFANGKSTLKVAGHYGRSPTVILRWFEESGAERATSNVPAERLAYPFILHEAKHPQHELLLLINEAIPKHLPPELRADMCQDLAIGCLTGEFDKDDLYLPAKEVAKRVYRMFPTKYGPLSLDAPLSSDSDFRLLDMLVDEGRDWA